jgi:hypothetical protein
MRDFGLPLLFFSFLLSVAITIACGVNAPRTLETVSLSPQSADAQDFSNGQVPFIATGYYSKSPSPVSPENALWTACFQGQLSSAVSFTQSGVAQCTAGASGTYAVFAHVEDPASKGCPDTAINPCAAACGMVMGMASLTCP